MVQSALVVWVSCKSENVTEGGAEASLDTVPYVLNTPEDFSQTGRDFAPLRKSQYIREKL